MIGSRSGANDEFRRDLRWTCRCVARTSVRHRPYKAGLCAAVAALGSAISLVTAFGACSVSNFSKTGDSGIGYMLERRARVHGLFNLAADRTALKRLATVSRPPFSYDRRAIQMIRPRPCRPLTMRQAPVPRTWGRPVKSSPSVCLRIAKHWSGRNRSSRAQAGPHADHVGLGPRSGHQSRQRDAGGGRAADAREIRRRELTPWWGRTSPWSSLDLRRAAR